MVYLVYGDQYPVVNKRVKRLIKSLLNDEEMDDFNYLRLNAREDLVQDIAFECSLVPFCESKVIRVDNPYFLGSIKEKVSIEKNQDYKALEDYLNNQTEGVNLVFVLESKTVNKKNEIYELIEKNGKVIYEEGLSSESLQEVQEQGALCVYIQYGQPWIFLSDIAQYPEICHPCGNKGRTRR